MHRSDIGCKPDSYFAVSMFSTNGLPVPSNFGHEHHPLRLTSKASPPQPSGACQSVLLRPSVHNQRCLGQNFLHDRGGPGNLCDCGHQTYFHSPSSLNYDYQRHREPVSVPAEHALSERIKRLEETLQHERELRENCMNQERQAWGREVRILREALAPFYKSEQDMRRKLVEIEDRIEGNYDEQLRMKERLVAVDVVSMGVERRLHDLETSRGKRRRISQQHLPEDIHPNGQLTQDARGTSSNVDDRSTYSASSRALSPNGTTSALPDSQEARSSGILNLMNMPRCTPHAAPRRKSPSAHEPRSSGFLALDLAERSRNRTSGPGRDPSPSIDTVAPEYQYPPPYARSNPNPSFERRSPGILRPIPSGLIANGMRISPPDLSPRKRKQFAALDVLADVSVASPLFH